MASKKKETSLDQLEGDSFAFANCDSSSFDSLTEEILYLILSFVPPLDLLRTVCLCCTRFSEAIQSELFWQKSMPSTAKLFHHDDDLESLRLSRHHLQRYAVYDDAVNSGDKMTLELLQHGSILSTREVSLRLRSQGKRTCAASTTDRVTESIENVLPLSSSAASSSSSRSGSPEPGSATSFFHRFRFSQTWWSSRPTPQPDTRNEVLLFTTRAPLCLMTQVQVKPLLDPYMGHVVYSWYVGVETKNDVLFLVVH